MLPLIHAEGELSESNPGLKLPRNRLKFSRTHGFMSPFSLWGPPSRGPPYGSPPSGGAPGDTGQRAHRAGGASGASGSAPQADLGS